MLCAGNKLTLLSGVIKQTYLDSMALHYANFLQVVHTLQIKTVDGLKSFQIQSGLIGHQPAYQNGVGERERERDREIGESETKIFRSKRTIHLGSKVTLSSSGNL